MPATYNFQNPITVDSSGRTAQSVRYWLFPSVVDQSVETNFNNTHYIKWDFFTGRNLQGTPMGSASWDSLHRSATEMYGNMSIDEIVAAMYPPPGPDN